MTISTPAQAPAQKRLRRRRLRFDHRSSGLLLHPTSLPGPHGSGDLGADAYAFADFLTDAKQRWWQMLPINPPGAPPGNSPYSSTSAFAGSPWLINLRQLMEDGLLDRGDIESSASFNGAATVNFGASQRFRLQRLRRAFAKFEGVGGLRDAKFRAFCEMGQSWLDDFTLYSAIKDANGDKAWSSWRAELRLRKPTAIREARQAFADGIRFHQFVQFVFQRQWNALKKYCNARDIGLIGDIPIFVAHDSADVWAHRELFLLDDAGRTTTISGYPPDAFNDLGQKWGHPHYDWPVHEREGFAWWVARFQRTLEQFDGARIDHFLGFDRTWHVPARARDARRGKWLQTPGDALFKTLQKAIGKAQIIAEDLGQLTAPAAALRDRFGFPGMRVMQFGFGDGGSYHLPHRFVSNCVAYTGTHDNETIVGWYDRLCREARNARRNSQQAQQLRKVKRYLCDLSRDGINWAMIRLAMSSVADTVIFPLQDILGLDESGRMNVPGTVDGNWRWRLKPGQLGRLHGGRLAELASLYDRV